MGIGFFDKLATMLGIRKREASVLVVGLDNSGKSTCLNHFKPEEQKRTDIVPTVGFTVERFKSEPRVVLSLGSWSPRRTICTLLPRLVLSHAE
jgi:GTPase SAR1 family protein